MGRRSLRRIGSTHQSSTSTGLEIFLRMHCWKIEALFSASWFCSPALYFKCFSSRGQQLGHGRCMNRHTCPCLRMPTPAVWFTCEPCANRACIVSMTRFVRFELTNGWDCPWISRVPARADRIPISSSKEGVQGPGELWVEQTTCIGLLHHLKPPA